VWNLITSISSDPELLSSSEMGDRKLRVPSPLSKFQTTRRAVRIRLNSRRFSRSINAFTVDFCSARYRGLSLETQVIEGERQAGNEPEGCNHATRFVFAGTARSK
jgi:hypothetical protein